MTTPAKAAADAAKASAPGVNQPPADPPEAIKPQIAHYLGLVRAIETELREALILVSERHERNYDISRGAATLATWSTEHLEWLEQPIARYGAAETDGPAKLRAAADLSAAAGDGALRVAIDEPLPLDRIAEAHDCVDAGGRARVVLSIPN